MAQNRDPKDVQAWLIGSGIASLAAAVHLVKQANVPACQVHILDIHKGSGGAMEEVTGNSNDGYVLHTGAQPYFHDDCVEELLTMVPSPNNPEKTVWETIKDYQLHGGPGNKAKTRVIRPSGDGSKVDLHSMKIGASFEWISSYFSWTARGRPIQRRFAMYLMDRSSGQNSGLYGRLREYFELLLI